MRWAGGGDMPFVFGNSQPLRLSSTPVSTVFWLRRCQRMMFWLKHRDVLVGVILDSCRGWVSRLASTAKAWQRSLERRAADSEQRVCLHRHPQPVELVAAARRMLAPPQVADLPAVCVRTPGQVRRRVW